jgi:septum formation protein
MIKHHIILSSNSPRRRELLSGLDLDFDIYVLKGIDESYPDGLQIDEIPIYISKEKSAAYKNIIRENDILITADTVVVVDEEILGKPKDAVDAHRMLCEISGRTHQVITGVCLTSVDKQVCFSVKTDVTFKELTEEEINYYIEKYKPYDKAGAYGIQEWIGYIGVTGINGSYFNVMGLPVQRIYKELNAF